MLKAIFTEVHREIGLPITVGEKRFEKYISIEKANSEARKYSEILSELRNTKVSYMLSKNNAIIANLN